MVKLYDLNSINSKNTIDTFNSELNDGGKKIAYVVHRPGCPACDAFIPKWNKFQNNMKNSSKLKDVILAKINVEVLALINIKNKNNIMGVPHIMMQHGNTMNEYNGNREPEDLKRWLLHNYGKKVFVGGTHDDEEDEPSLTYYKQPYREDALKKGNVGDYVYYEPNNQMGMLTHKIVLVDGKKELETIGDWQGLYDDPNHPDYINYDTKGGKKIKSKKNKKSKKILNKRKKTKKNKRKQKGGSENIKDCINKQDPISMEELKNIVKFKTKEATKENSKIYNCYNKDTLKRHIINQNKNLKKKLEDILDPLTNKPLGKDFIKTNYPELIENDSKIQDDPKYDPYNDDNDLTDDQRDALRHHEYIFDNATNPNDYVYTFNNATKSVTKRSTPQEIFVWHNELKQLLSQEQSNRGGGKSKKNKKKYIKRKSKKSKK